MIPLVCDVKELKQVKKIVVETADEEIKLSGTNLEYSVGTMIEIPRACIIADEIAKEADFFCFGTNDLTQMTYGFSRDDAGKFLNAYYDTKILENDPFAKLDKDGVGKLMKMAVNLGRPEKSTLHVGICGEHGGDPSSVEFCNSIGLDYVSCSPFRVPIARLAAAQAAIASASEDKKERRTEKVEDHLKEAAKQLSSAAKDAAVVGKDVAKVVAKDASVVAKAGLAGAKAGWQEAKKSFKDNI